MDIYKYLFTFIISGFTVTGISYFGNVINPALGGILSSIPISIPAMLTITNHQNRSTFISNAFIMVTFLAVLTAICAYLNNKTRLSSWNSVIVTMVIWFIGAILFYYFHARHVNLAS